MNRGRVQGSEVGGSLGFGGSASQHLTLKPSTDGARIVRGVGYSFHSMDSMHSCVFLKTRIRVWGVQEQIHTIYYRSKGTLVLGKRRSEPETNRNAKKLEYFSPARWNLRN